MTLFEDLLKTNYAVKKEMEFMWIATLKVTSITIFKGDIIFIQIRIFFKMYPGNYGSYQNTPSLPIFKIFHIF